MTRARWITGGFIGVGALAVAGDALASYLATLVTNHLHTGRFKRSV